jgi:uncharacterized protein
VSPGVVVVFAKPPLPGHVKTRLVPPLTPAAAAAVHEALLRDTIAGVRAAAPDLRVAYDDTAGARAYFRRSFPGLPLLPQAVGDLGARMAAAFGELFGEGAERVVVIGADTPTLPWDRVPRALGALGASDVVIGPATDGGYYLVGLRSAAWPLAGALFQGIRWSTGTVLRVTRDRAADARLDVHLLPEWYDVDVWADLRRASRDSGPGSHLARLMGGAKWRRSLAPLTP